MSRLLHHFESLLVKSRFLVIIAVIASLVTSVATFVLATVDVGLVIRSVVEYARWGVDAEARMAARADAITLVVKAIDGYLLATIMLIFAVGLYELFIGKVERLYDPNVGSRVLLIESFDDLKERLSRVILLILVVKFLQQALDMKYERPLDILILAAGIMGVAIAQYIAGLKVEKTAAGQPRDGAAPDRTAPAAAADGK